MKKTIKTNGSSRKKATAAKISFSQRNARRRMMASRYGKEFYRFLRGDCKSAPIYMWWLEKSMHTLGHRSPNRFLKERTAHGLDVQLGTLKSALKRKNVDQKDGRNIISVFKRYANWQKSKGSLQAAA